MAQVLPESDWAADRLQYLVLAPGETLSLRYTDGPTLVIQDTDTVSPVAPALRPPTASTHRVSVVVEQVQVCLLTLVERLPIVNSSDAPLAPRERDKLLDSLVELSRLTLDGLMFTGWNDSTRQATASLSITDCQLDNQLHWTHFYDFPVIMSPETRRHLSGNWVTNMSRLHDWIEDEIKQNSFCSTRLVLSSGLHLSDLHVRFQPLVLRLEDQWIIDFWSMIRSYQDSDSCVRALRRVTTSLPAPSSPEFLHDYRDRFVTTIQRKLFDLGRPLRVNSLRIDPFSVMLNAHASMTVYVSTSDASVNLPGLERTGLNSSTSSLFKELSEHYTRSAIYRAGMVLGSLELLGNPVALIRDVLSGFADVLTDPFREVVHRGPLGIFYGFGTGFGSLLRKTSHGTIRSVSNLASSLSRNVQLWTRDRDRSEGRHREARSPTPRGLSDGLRTGLSSFGISLLGAVAGLADKPLQELTHRSSDPSSGRPEGSLALGLAGGVARGAVSLVARPVGGAADLVAQTCKGLMASTGLTTNDETRSPCRVLHICRLQFAENELVTHYSLEHQLLASLSCRDSHDGRPLLLLLDTNSLHLVDPLAGEAVARLPASAVLLELHVGAGGLEELVLFERHDLPLGQTSQTETPAGISSSVQATDNGLQDAAPLPPEVCPPVPEDGPSLQWPGSQGGWSEPRYVEKYRLVLVPCAAGSGSPHPLMAAYACAADDFIDMVQQVAG